MARGPPRWPEEAADMRVGSGEFTYEVAEGWGVLPDGWRLGQTAAVATP